LEVGIKKTERTPIYKPYAEVLKRLGFVTYWILSVLIGYHFEPRLM
jgi:hypothetical protein